jgi:hypothetical protein
VTPQLLIFISHRLNAFLRVILRIALAISYCRFTRWNPVSCHNFISLCLCCRRWSRHGSSLFISEGVSLRVDRLYAEQQRLSNYKLLFQLLQQCHFGSWEKLRQKLGFETAPSLCGFEQGPKCP